jgi:hypothetical protein
MFKVGALALIGFGFLAGCDTRPLNELSYAEQQEMLAKFTAICAESGVTEKSPEYRRCVQTEINAENARRSRQSEGMTKFGQGLAAAGNNYSAAARTNAPVTCRTTPAVGWGSSTTTCY